jgi:hypothetical protein
MALPIAKSRGVTQLWEIALAPGRMALQKCISGRLEVRLTSWRATGDRKDCNPGAAVAGAGGSGLRLRKS